MPSPSTILKSFYKPLDKDRHEIRLVRLHPSKGMELPISCELFIRSLDKGPKPNFSALSYEWGSPFGDKESIFLNNIEVEIRPNLWSALKRLRQADEDVTIWIDALCINQEDHEEKKYLVNRMCNIYKNATVTFAWLGDERDDSDIAIVELSRLGKHFADLYANYKTAAADGMVHTTKLSAPEIEEEMRKKYTAGDWKQAESLDRLIDSFGPCRALLSRSYWRRIWIIQEVTVSSRVEVICGNFRMDFNHLRGAIILMSIFLQRVLCFFATKFSSYPIKCWPPEDVELIKNLQGDIPRAAATIGKCYY